MVIVKILNEEKFNGNTIFLKKLVMFRGERAGDRIRIISIGLSFDKDDKPYYDTHYTGLEQEEAITIYKLMNEEL